MTCSDFLLQFSEFYDGQLGSNELEPFRRHLRTCGPCRRYHRVVERGGEVLRGNSDVRPASDFRDRLQHSIYLMEEERRRRRIPRSGSGGTAFVVLAAALAVAVLAAPVLWEGDPSVELPVILVYEPELAGSIAGPSLRSALDSQVMDPRESSLPFEQVELWSQSNQLLFQHSSLFLRNREASLVRAGIR